MITSPDDFSSPLTVGILSSAAFVAGVYRSAGNNPTLPATWPKAPTAATSGALYRVMSNARCGGLSIVTWWLQFSTVSGKPLTVVAPPLVPVPPQETRQSTLATEGQSAIHGGHLLRAGWTGWLCRLGARRVEAADENEQERCAEGGGDDPDRQLLGLEDDPGQYVGPDQEARTD